MCYSRFLLALVIVLVTSSIAGCAPPCQPLSALTAAEKDEMVQAHNAWRAKYYSDSPLQWSETVACQAQQWADYLASQGYVLQHSSSGYGENLGAGHPTPTDLVNDWCSESTQYSGQTMDNENYKIFGHFTQVVWKATTKVGCGVARDNAGQVVWVCNYNPPGNYVGQKPY
ncbi:MAG: CAP family protein [Chloroflexi bacterium]|nr:CAP family protein [Chloroflexota bacterium]